jgi:microcystin-dependent protein
MKKILVSFTCLLSLAWSQPAAADGDPFIAEVMVFAGNFCPKGWAAMNGQLLPINQNQALFSLLGTNYGGNGTTTFALPTARPIFDANGVALTQCIALVGIFPSRD